ncbi:MAG TPA: CDP-diacylglycerol--glycerol-3-phosphate 3-phosphatidyltransferase [Sulfuricaulis sp.]|nr:CDP-diacylglycerol--glycerol-3-phosphate 3-phosphatidyltransferase [Gammaproteobacteria bacterium]MDH3406581.1 CDP-diacylglycerol--glycerol-3-phosphate 3-phosphatidyltransferase [Gammaproteobacteria bacterium]MDH5488039.1 CDP-diacylglycerol--glycerol-3-phosphate 3-phosphatidyltransferase [Gammaproteobacteria bacterium]HEU5339050.1 CDP-diacylglycerol--glycerol-3-phosphate 3-phosphatidyltransferase [Sulfuricaulis sp.]
MLLNAPNVLTLLRIALIPAFIVAYYWTHPMSHMLATGLFVLAALTDWLDGYLARKLQQTSHFGTFLDPVADKLMIAAALVMLVADPKVQAHVLDIRLFAVVVLVIVGREITVSALREWMSEVGKRSHVAVSFLGKIKTISQMVAIPFLLWQQSLWGLPVFRIGEILLYLAGALTLWSMLAYLKAAWPNLIAPR